MVLTVLLTIESVFWHIQAPLKDPLLWILAPLTQTTNNLLTNRSTTTHLYMILQRAVGILRCLGSPMAAYKQAADSFWWQSLQTTNCKSAMLYYTMVNKKRLLSYIDQQNHVHGVFEIWYAGHCVCYVTTCTLYASLSKTRLPKKNTHGHWATPTNSPVNVDLPAKGIPAR